MRTLIANVRTFLRDEEGLTVIEYAVAGGLIVVGIIAAIGVFTGDLNTVFTHLGTALTNGTSTYGK